MIQPTYEEQNIEERDGLLIDLDTGEIVGVSTPDGGHIVGQDAAFTIDNEEKANWLLGKLLKRDAAIASANLVWKAQEERMESIVRDAIETAKQTPEYLELAAVADNCQRIVDRHEKERTGLLDRFAYELKLFAQRALEGARTRTLRLPYGTLSLRKTGGRWKVTDDATFCEWALKHQPKAVKLSPLISKFDPYADDDESDVPGVEFVPEDDELKVETGIGGKA